MFTVRQIWSLLPTIFISPGAILYQACLFLYPYSKALKGLPEHSILGDSDSLAFTPLEFTTSSDFYFPTTTYSRFISIRGDHSIYKIWLLVY